MPLRQLYPDPSEDSAKVDIIAVHGLNPLFKKDSEHAWDTWRTPSGQQGRLWLRDDLPQTLPESRIFLYEYNSSAVYGKDRDTFIGKANELLEAIRIERDGVESRPILLLGHSMGGLLIKQALINAHNNPMYTSIKNATKGLAFFATPHNGADQTLVSLGGVASKIATTMGFQKGDDVVETLKKESIFSEILHELWRQQLLHYDIISFWGAFDKYVPRNSARFDLPGDKDHVVKLNADHSGVCKFGTCQTDQDNLKVVQYNIKRLYKIALQKCRSNIPVLTNVPYTLRPATDEELQSFDVTPKSDDWLYPPEERFCRAVKNGDVASVTELLSQGVKVDTIGLFRSGPALYDAITEGHNSIIELLLEHGANIESRTRGLEYTPLLCAVELKNMQSTVVDMLLRRGANVDAKDYEGRMALHIAAELGHADIAQLLVNWEADVEARSGSTHKTPLYLAAENGHASVVKVLLSKGARIEYQDKNHTRSALLCASEKGHEAVVRLLLAKGADTTIQHRFSGSVPIQRAVENDHSGVVELWLGYGVDIRTTNECGQDLLHLAVMNNSAQVVQLLCKRGIDKEKSWGPESCSPLLLAAIEGHYASVECLLDTNTVNIESKDSKGRTALYLAFCNKHESVSVLLLERGADIQSINKFADPALLTAARRGQIALVRLLVALDTNPAATNASGETSLHCAAYGGYKEVLEFLLAKSVPIDMKCHNGLTPTHCAALNGNLECVKFLLENGADLHTSDNQGQTCLHKASQGGHKDVVSLLVEAGANRNAKDTFGWTSLRIASEAGNSDIVDLLLKGNQGVDIEVDGLRLALCEASSNGHQLCAQLLIDKGANVNGTAGTTPPLFIAASNGHDNIVELLLTHGADPTVSCTVQQHTVLDAATHSGNVTVVQRLLKQPIDIAAKDVIGQTALHKAAFLGHQAIVRLLLDAGASPGEVSEGGWLPIHGAALQGHRETLLLLLQRGSSFGSLQDMFEDDLQQMYKSSPTALSRLFLGHRQAWKAVELAVLNADLTALHSHLAQGAKINGEHGHTALHIAAFKGYEELVQVLIEQYKFDVNARLQDGSTVLHHAARQANVVVVRILLGNGATLNCTDFYGYTALHYAAMAGHEEVVRTLVEKGIDMTIESRQGLTALQIAEKMEMCTITAILSNHFSAL